MKSFTGTSYVSDYNLDITFNTGERKRIDLESQLWGEVFEPLKDRNLFSQFIVNDFTIEWPNGADFAPEFLYEAGR